MKNNSFHFTDSHFETAIRALDTIIELVQLNGDSRNMLADTTRARKRLIQQKPDLTVTELKIICIGLSMLIDDDPWDIQANSLLNALAPVCGFVNSIR